MVMIKTMGFKWQQKQKQNKVIKGIKRNKQRKETNKQTNKKRRESNF
jgi:hypothetical protein